MNRLFGFFSVVGTLIVLCSFLILPASGEAQGPQGLSPKEAQEIAMDAYIYGYSLITTDITRDPDEQRGQGREQCSAPTGTFFNIKGYPPATYRGVSATNADTLYSVAWLDLSEPQVFSHPEIKQRFFTFELVDLWMIVKNSVGTNTSGSKAMTYLFTGPDWKGNGAGGNDTHQLPDALHGHFGPYLRAQHAKGPGQSACPAGAIQGRAFLGLRQALHVQGAAGQCEPGLQHDRCAPEGDRGPGNGRLLQPDGASLMGSAAAPAPEDAPMLARMAKIGIVPGKPFDPGKLDSGRAGRPEGCARDGSQAYDCGVGMSG